MAGVGLQQHARTRAGQPEAADRRRLRGVVHRPLVADIIKHGLLGRHDF